MNLQPTIKGYRHGQVEGYSGHLPPRQLQTLVCAADGLSIPETAREMNCSTSNIKNLRADLFYHLRAKKMTDAICKATSKGILRYLLVAWAMVISTGVLEYSPGEDLSSTDDLQRPIRLSRRGGRSGRRTGRSGRSGRNKNQIWLDELCEIV